MVLISLSAKIDVSGISLRRLITANKVFGTHLRKLTLKNASKILKIVYIRESRTRNISGNHIFVLLFFKEMFYQKIILYSFDVENSRTFNIDGALRIPNTI